MAASLPAGLNLLPQPSLRLSSSSSSPSPATTAALRSSPEDVRKEVEEEIRNLHSENQVVVIKRLEEEITDAPCALAVHEEMRNSLVEKGVVSRLASKLTTESPEICVRALLDLGMLCGYSLEAQEHFAETDGAIATLLSLMKSNDQDIRAIARDLYAALGMNEQVKPIIEQLLRSSSASRAI